MDKPVAAIERLRDRVNGLDAPGDTAILAYLDSIPEGAVPVVWPKEWTRERLEELAATSAYRPHYEALCAIAAIAPERKKRVVNLWQKNAEQTFADVDCDGSFITAGWQKMNRTGPIEIEE